VLADISFPGKWTQYSWSGVTWDRIHTQRFDTTRYWKYIDWKAETFNELKPVFATVDELYQLDTLNSTLGDYIKVKESNGLTKKYIIEIKPQKQTIEPKVPKRKTKSYIYEVVEYAKNQAKWKAAEEWCLDRGYEFKVLTENELGIK
jgi:hypothetical protein